MTNTKRKTYDEVKKEIEEISENSYLESNEYINSSTKNLIICHYTENGDLHRYVTSRELFLHANGRCPICHKIKLKSGNYVKKNSRKTIEQFRKEVKEKYNGEYKVITKEYKNNKTKMKFKHITKEGFHYFYMTPNDFLYGHKCPICCSKLITTEIFNERLNKLYNGEYILNGEYKRKNERNQDNKIEIIHKKCNNIFSKYYYSVTDGSMKCPICYPNSLGEELVKQVLTDLKINFIQQYSFNDCLSKKNKKLRFDFAIFDNKNKKIKFLIEYDGYFHFNSKYKYYKESIKLQKERDEIKNNYCKNNKILLLRINKLKTYNEIKNYILEFIFKEVF